MTGGLTVQIKWDEAGVTRVGRMLGSYEGVQLTKTLNAAFGKELKALVGPMRSEMDSMGIHTGVALKVTSHGKSHTVQTLKASIGVRKERLRPGESAAFAVGPRSHLRHLIIRGHRMVTRYGVDTGHTAKAFPFVDPVIERYAGAIVERVSSELWARGVVGAL